MYQLIPSLTITPDDPRGFARSHCLGVRDFESEKFSIVFKDKCSTFSICLKETGDSSKRRCSCAVSCQLLQKQYMSTVSLITLTISAISIILINFQVIQESVL